MAWYEPRIETPYDRRDSGETEHNRSTPGQVTETDRMWRRIAPQLQAKVEQAVDGEQSYSSNPL